MMDVRGRLRRLRRIIGRPGCDVVLLDKELGYWTEGARCGKPTVARDSCGWRFCERHAPEFGLNATTHPPANVATDTDAQRDPLPKGPES